MKNSLSSLAFDALIEKIIQVKEGKVRKGNFGSNLEQIEFDMIKNLLSLESHIINNPEFEIMESENYDVLLMLDPNEILEHEPFL